MNQNTHEPPHDKTNKMACAPSEDRSVRASAQSDQSSLSAWRNLGSLATYWAHCEDSDQTGWMPRLILVFLVRTRHIVGFVMLRLTYKLRGSSHKKLSDAQKNIHVFSKNVILDTEKLGVARWYKYACKYIQNCCTIKRTDWNNVI